MLKKLNHASYELLRPIGYLIRHETNTCDKGHIYCMVKTGRRINGLSRTSQNYGCVTLLFAGSTSLRNDAIFGVPAKNRQTTLFLADERPIPAELLARREVLPEESLT